MTPAQLVILKSDILADPTLNAFPNGTTGNFEVAKAYNELASPAFTVWKVNVSITQIGDNLVATELAGLSTLNSTRLQTIAVFSSDGVNPSLSDRRAFFDDVFSGSGGALTRAKLLTLWKRLATRAEKLFSIGTGTDSSPASTTFMGAVSLSEVQAARDLP